MDGTGQVGELKTWQLYWQQMFVSTQLCKSLYFLVGKFEFIAPNQFIRPNEFIRPDRFLGDPKWPFLDEIGSF